MDQPIGHDQTIQVRKYPVPDDIQIKKRSVCIAGHSTSLTIEDEFWDLFKDIAQRRKTSINALISEIDEHNTRNLSSAVRVYVLKDLEQRLAQ